MSLLIQGIKLTYKDSPIYIDQIGQMITVQVRGLWLGILDTPGGLPDLPWHPHSLPFHPQSWSNENFNWCPSCFQTPPSKTTPPLLWSPGKLLHVLSTSSCLWAILFFRRIPPLQPGGSPALSPPPALGTQPWTKTLRPWPTRGGYWASRTFPRSRSAPSRSVTLNKGIGSDGASLVAQMVKSLPEMQETQVWSLGQEDPLEKGMATHCSILAWRVPWTEEPGGLQSVRSQTVRHNWATNNFTFIRSDIFQVVKWQKINSEQLKKKGKKKLWATGSSSNILIRHLGRSPGGGHGNPQQYSCLENPNGQRGAWWATVHGVAKSRTWLSD